MISRCICAWKSKGGDDSRDIAKPHLPGCADRPLPVPFQVHAEPAYDDRQDANHTHSIQHQTCKFSFTAGVNCEENEVTTNGDTETDSDEYGAILDLVRYKGHCHSEDNGGSPRDHRMELRFDRFITIASDDRGNKVCKSLSSQY